MSFKLRHAGLAFGTALLLSANVAIAQESGVDTRDVVHDNRAQVIVNTFGNCVRTKWVSQNTDPCGAPVAAAPTYVQPPVARREIAKEERTVYFDFNKAALTSDSQARLNTLANTLKSDTQVKEARIFGYADRIGTDSYNDKLSQKRAETVRKYLVSQGFVKSRTTETRWFGESNPATKCPNDLKRAELISCLQKDRRVEIEIDYLPQTGNYYQQPMQNR